jgi:flagellar biosynthetic protein FliQ
MNEADALEIVHRTITVVLLVSAPMVLAAMVTGIIVAVFQALTQIQEMTLTFVPKIIAMLVALSLSSAFIGSSIYSLSQFAYARIETGF